MIFDTIRYGIFTADDFVYAHTTNDFSKFRVLPPDLKKQFISDVIDLYPSMKSTELRQMVFDVIDEKMAMKRFREAWWKYWGISHHMATTAGASEASVIASVVVAGVMAVMVFLPVMGEEYYLPCLEQHALHLNKLIKEYE